ncbi:transposase [Burkholderiaceae bacterium 16]|nr:transposase [Burkholderiaceae bacterium 16]
MNFLDGHLFPENQQPLIITAAPYAPGWLPSDFPEDIPVSMEDQIQKAVDCYNAGATVLHLHVRELDGKGSKRLSKFNELIAGVRKAVPEMIIQVGGSISFAPENEGQAAKWLSDDTRHMLADLDPTPDQVTVTVNTSQMNVTDHAEDADFKGTSRENPAIFNAYKEMTVPAQPGWVEEHVRRLSAKGIQSAFQCYNTNSFESVERLMRRGFYRGPLVMNWVAIGGGMDTPNVYSLGNFMRGVPDGAVVTVESNVRNVLPVNMMGIAMGLHVRCGTEDCLWNQSRTEKQSTVKQIEQLVRISREFGREIATAKQAREISRIGVFYDTVEESLQANGFAPNRNGGTQGYLRKTR